MALLSISARSFLLWVLPGPVPIRLMSPGLCLSDWAEACPVALEGSGMENIPQFRANALDRLVAAGKIREIDRDRVTFIVRTIHPPRADSLAREY